MSILRIYPSKSNTIASGLLQSYNSGQNEVADLFYGGDGIYSSISRLLLQFDLTDLQNKLSDLTINRNLGVTYKLRMTNAIPGDDILKQNCGIATSFDLLCFPINKEWDQGRGHNLSLDQYVLAAGGNPVITGYSNWNQATSTTAWDAPGVYGAVITGSTAVTSFSTQHFDLGNEDISMDITSIVNSWLTGGTQNNGLGVAYTQFFESMTSNTRFASAFFREKTHTAFKPFIEVSYGQIIKDDRDQVSNNRISRLFLYTFSGNSAANYFSSGTVSILSSNNAVVYSGLTPTQMEKGVYFVDVWMSGTTPGQKYKDVWSNVTFIPGIDQQNFTQNFLIQNNYYFNNAPHVNAYSLVTYGIDNNSIISNTETLRVYVDIHVNYSRKAPATAYDLQYRLVMNNQIEVIPYTSVNQIVMGCPTNYFVLNTDWLLNNQTYRIDFKINELGTSRILSENITFKVLRDF